ncbi:MAG TPA: AAA family ATPase [Acidimicrobiales bacterium]|nr:AAA family ATPase [Acidimicrobiales bacterium]
MASPEALILAGPNGAGKTTSSVLLVPPGTRFLNADLIVEQLLEAGTSPRGIDIAAGRVLLAELRAVVAGGSSFCIETNLADRGLARRVAEWRSRGYVVRLVFTALDSPDLAVARVATRAASGGHDVPVATVQRRWSAGLRALFDLYLPLVDHWIVFDSSNGPIHPVALGGRPPTIRWVFDRSRWQRLVALAREAGASAVGDDGEIFDPVAPIDDDGQPER